MLKFVLEIKRGLFYEVEWAVDKNWVTGTTMILATDNLVTKCVFEWNLFSPYLYKLVTRLRCVRMKYLAKVLVTHVSGLMIQCQETDGSF